MSAVTYELRVKPRPVIQSSWVCVAYTVLVGLGSTTGSSKTVATMRPFFASVGPTGDRKSVV